MNGRAIGAVVFGVVASMAWLWLGVPALGGILGESTDAAGGEALFTALVFGPILLLAVAGGRICGIRAVAPGATPVVASGRGAAVAFAGLALATGYAALAGTLTQGLAAGAAWVAPGMIVVALQVLAEEALFRGWMQPVLARLIGVPGAVVATSLGFAAMHVAGGASGAIVLVNLFVGGLLFGALAAQHGGIAGAVAAHWAWNAGEQLLLGLDPNPGVGAFGAVLNLDLVGAAVWGGSDAGLNGSLAMTFALLAVTGPRLWGLRADRSGRGGAIPVDRIPRSAKPR